MRALLLLAALAACAGLPQGPVPEGSGVRPRQAVLYRDTVTVAMTDGSLCTGVRRAPAGRWAATLSGCPHGWPVSVARTAPVPRLPLAPALDDPWVTLRPPEGPPLGFAPAGRTDG